jgi:energy-coupling factor transporter ATP-binding protein EcfA2
MRIKKIDIKNYKVFYKEHIIEADGKNLFIYGENGSGKSSLYFALKDFFQSSREEINFDDLENVFLTKSEQGKGFIKVTFNPDNNGHPIDKLYEFKSKSKDTYIPPDTSIRDAIGLKSFLTYKHLLGIHNVKKGNEIDLFDLLVKGVLKHFKSAAITGSKELGELWEDVENRCKKPLEGVRYNSAKKKKDVESTIGTFNKAFSELFKENNPDYILKATHPILKEFNHNIELKLNYTQAKPNENYSGYTNNHVRIKLKYLSKDVREPHLFLNEARLSAIAISIYLGMILRHPQINIKAKILFLDDIFIGLDISNRLPLMEILKKHFISADPTKNYQIFITTYDKPWYEFIKFYLSEDRHWKTIELYARRAKKGFEIPIIKPQSGTSFIQNLIDIAEGYYNKADNKASGVYLRAAFEFMLKKYCEKKSIQVKYVLDSSTLTSKDFWAAVKKYRQENLTKPGNCAITVTTETNIDHYIKLVLNPLSHNTINKHEISSEILAAIATIKTLKIELGV